MSILLKDIAEISLGFNINKTKEQNLNSDKFGDKSGQNDQSAQSDQSTQNHDYKILSLKAFQGGRINALNAENLSLAAQINEKFLVHKGDILLKLNAPVSAAFVEIKPQRLIFPHSMLKIKVINPNFNAKFLAFYLNSNAIKRQFVQYFMQSGTIFLLKISDILRLKIAQIPLQTQIQMLKILELSQRKSEILQDLIKANEAFSMAILGDLAQKFTTKDTK